MSRDEGASAAVESEVEGKAGLRASPTTYARAICIAPLLRPEEAGDGTRVGLPL